VALGGPAVGGRVAVVGREALGGFSANVGWEALGVGRWADLPSAGGWRSLGAER